MVSTFTPNIDKSSYASVQRKSTKRVTTAMTCMLMIICVTVLSGCITTNGIRPQKESALALEAEDLLKQEKFSEAEKAAQKAVLENNQDSNAFYYLAKALEKQNKLEEAGRAYTKSLDLYETHPGIEKKEIVMNALALNLASQNRFNEATTLLRKAHENAPYNRDIKRNLRIVTALQQASLPPVPKPPAKPDQIPEQQKTETTPQKTDSSVGSPENRTESNTENSTER